VHNSPKDILENLVPVWLLVRTNLFVQSRFWTTYTKFDDCYQRYIATYGNRCASTFQALKHHGVLSSNLSAIYTKWCAQTFRNFWPQFRENCGAPSEMGIMYCIWKGDPLQKNHWKPHQNWPIEHDAIPVQSMSPSNEQLAWLRVWQIAKFYEPNKQTNTIFSHLQLARVVRFSPNFARW